MRGRAEQPCGARKSAAKMTVPASSTSGAPTARRARAIGQSRRRSSARPPRQSWPKPCPWRESGRYMPPRSRSDSARKNNWLAGLCSLPTIPTARLTQMTAGSARSATATAARYQPLSIFHTANSMRPPTIAIDRSSEDEVAGRPIHSLGVQLHCDERRGEQRDRRAPADDPPGTPPPGLPTILAILASMP